MTESNPGIDPPCMLPSLDATGGSRPTWPMILRRIVFWIGICSISASPSLSLTLRDDEFPTSALILGILTFATGAGIMTSLPWVRGMTRHPRLRKSVLVAYIIRTVFASIPLAPVMIDLWVGMIAIGTGGLLFDLLQSAWQGAPPSYLPFLSTYFLVLWQGVLLNMLVWVIVLFAWLFQRIFMTTPIRGAGEACPGCQYDLRSTPPGCPCPECGQRRLARCADCDHDLTPDVAVSSCPECGSTRGYVDPRTRSWIERATPKDLLLIVVGCLGWAALMTLFNQSMV